MMILVFLSGSLLGAFITAAIAYIAHLNHTAEQRNHWMAKMKQREDLAYNKGCAYRAMLPRTVNHDQEGVKPWQR